MKLANTVGLLCVVAAVSVCAERSQADEPEFAGVFKVGMLVRVDRAVNGASVDLHVYGDESAARETRIPPMQIRRVEPNYLVLMSDRSQPRPQLELILPLRSVRLVTREVKRQPAATAAAGIDASLSRVIKVGAQRTPLREYVETLAAAAEVPIHLDGDGLKLAGYTQNMPQNVTAEARTLRVYLRELTKQYPSLVVIANPERPGLMLTTTAITSRSRNIQPIDLREPNRLDDEAVSTAALEAILKSVRNRLTNTTRSVGAYNSTFLSVPQDGALLVAVARAAAAHEKQVSWLAHREAIEQAGMALAANPPQRGIAGQNRVRHQLDVIDAALTGNSSDLQPQNSQQKIDADDLRSLLMKQNHAAVEKIKAATGGEDALSTEQAGELKTSAAVPILVSWLLQAEDFPEHDDENYLEHARRLHQTSILVRDSVNFKEPQEISRRLANMVQSCSKCHEEYR